jgi:hypothetical protein
LQNSLSGKRLIDYFTLRGGAKLQIVTSDDNTFALPL